MMTRRLSVPLAWLNLTHNRVRMALFCAGIGFAVVLMFLQYGCRNALLDSSVLLLRKIRADLVVVSRRQTTILLRSPISRLDLARARSVQGVDSIHPLYIEYSRSVLRNTSPNEKDRRPSAGIRVLGVSPDAYLLEFPALDPNSPASKVSELQLEGRALFDRGSKSADNVFRQLYTHLVGGGEDGGNFSYGPVRVGTETDLSGQRIRFVGLFKLGIDFGTDGTIIVGTDTFRRVLRSSPYGPTMDDVDVGLIRLAPKSDPRKVKTSLQHLLGDGVSVLTKQEFMDREKLFWKENTPIGYVFGFGMFMGFLVGLVICYQILSTDIRDNLSAYATLRALGYPNRYLARVVFEESLLLAGLGFVPGLAVSAFMYWFLAVLTDLPMSLNVWRMLTIFGLTVIMCVGSGLLAVRQAQQADPAEVF